jgi:predicted PurR-regulated permease PerM
MIRPNPKDPARRRAQFASNRVLTYLAVGALLYFGHAAFVPIALALLFALVLSSPVEALHRLHVPRSLSAGIILLLALVIVAGMAELVWAPSQQWFDRAPQAMAIARQKLHPLAIFATHIEELRTSATTIERGSSAAAAAPTAVVSESAPMMLFAATRAAAITTLAFVVVTLFLLAGGPPMLARMTAAFVDDLNSSHVLGLIEKVRREVGRFYVTTGLINLFFGCATAAAMALCGMPTPLLWGALAGLLNFIPYAGSATTLVILTFVALVSCRGMAPVAAVAGSYLLLAGIVGQIVQPLLVGRRLQVNPLLIFLALWFCGIFWGVAGIILATPILLTLKVLAEHAEGGAALRTFLGPNDPATLLSKLGSLPKLGSLRR